MTEDQKYQGHLYREKPVKGQKKGQNTPNNKNAKANANARNQQPRVEDAIESDNAKFADAPPPPAPSPPPVAEAKPTAEAMTKPPVNVFDYLVTDETPNASKVSLAGPKEQMSMVADPPSLFQPSTALAKLDTKTDDEGNYDIAYEENGFSYGADPIPPSVNPNNVPNHSTEFVTPAPKKKDRRKEEKRISGSVSEKKRKRGQEEHFSSPQQEIDTPMMDAPSSIINNAGTPILNHSGLTGGLNRMMRSPSHELDDTPAHGHRTYQDVSSPIKRSKRNGKEKEVHGNGDPGLGISVKNRASRLVSSMFSGTGSVVSTSSAGNEKGDRAIVRTRRGSSSSADMPLEVRKKKSSRSREADDSRKSKRKSSNPTDGDRPTRRLKQTEESPHRESRQVTVYKQSKPPARTDDVLQREMAGHFLSGVSRDTERGCSVHKALKRFHRDFTDEYDYYRDRDYGRSRTDERCREDEKDLWRALRLRRNDRGEIVLFI